MAKQESVSVPLLMYLLVLTPYIIFGFMLQYLYKLEKSNCKCAVNKKQKLLKNSILLWLGINLFNLFTAFFNNTPLNFMKIIENKDLIIPNIVSSNPKILKTSMDKNK